MERILLSAHLKSLKIIKNIICKSEILLYYFLSLPCFFITYWFNLAIGGASQKSLPFVFCSKTPKSFQKLRTKT